MTKKMNPVVHFEMPAKDRNRVAKFYSEAFGWEMKIMGPEMGNYVLADTAETDENRMIKTKGAINGGFFEYKKEEGFEYPHVVISVDNIEQSMKMVEKAGGKIMGKPMDIPTVGKYAAIIDSEGNHVGMLQTSR